MPFLIGILLAFVVAPASAQAPAVAPPVIVGAVVSETGILAGLAADYRRALILWHEELNRAGGLLKRRVALRLLDDGSDAKRSGELYAQLIREKADLLIGPFGSAATLTASAQAESARRVLINGAGPSLAVHQRSPRYLFQTTISNAAYGVGVLEIVKAQGFSSATILARNDHTAREIADATRDRALKQGLKVAAFQVYAGGTENFATHVEKGRADAWIVFGEVRDTADILRTLRKVGYAPGLFFARSADDLRLIALVGQDAEYALATQEYDPKFRTQGNEQFAAAYAARWSAQPSFAAAQGYAAGTVLAAQLAEEAEPAEGVELEVGDPGDREHEQRWPHGVPLSRRTRSPRWRHCERPDRWRRRGSGRTVPRGRRPTSTPPARARGGADPAGPTARRPRPVG